MNDDQWLYWVKIAAKTAAEFVRQRLAPEEVEKRLVDAMILSRLSGYESTESVEALTEAIKRFDKE